MHNWLDHFKIRFHQLHASGHMNRQQIAGLINYIKPKRIFPIHTENQQKRSDDKIRKRIHIIIGARIIVSKNRISFFG